MIRLEKGEEKVRLSVRDVHVDRRTEREKKNINRVYRFLINTVDKAFFQP